MFIVAVEMESTIVAMDAPRAGRIALSSRWLTVVIAIAAMIVSVAGSGSQLPLDDHEVLVARTAEEMLQRGSVIVPYFNDEPRLTKPPLAYWLTMLTDAVNDRNGVISEWEARVPPIFGGIVFALATWSMGNTLLGGVVGFIAALMLVTTSGFVTYTHSARPEMLYAACCTAGLACFAISWRRVTESERDVPRKDRNLLWPSLGWMWMGLAILCKGPQLPLILLAAWGAGMIAIGQRRDVLRTLRPASGLLIAAAIALWWFIIMWNTVPGSGDRMERETLGRIFQIEGKSVAKFLDPYYLYRVVGLIAPWVIPYLLALALPLIRQVRMPRAARLLWWISVLTLVVMHVSLNRRWYYLLPLLGVLTTLMAYGSVAVGQSLLNAHRTKSWRALTSAHAMVCLVVVGWLWWRDTEAHKPPVAGIIALCVVGLLTIIWLMTLSRSTLSAAGALAAVCFVAMVMWTVASVRSSQWSPERFARRGFALQVASMLPDENIRLIGWQNDWQHEQYYLHRSIPTMKTHAALHHALREYDGGYLLSSSLKDLDLPRDVHLMVMHEVEVEPGESVSLWRVQVR